MFCDVSVIIYLLKKIDDDETIDSEMIRKAGYDVYAGEQDRFGWLTGCIEMKRGVIVFG